MRHETETYNDAWDNCTHEWEEVESQFEGAIECSKCECPGAKMSDKRAEDCGEDDVFWPAT